MKSFLSWVLLCDACQWLKLIRQKNPVKDIRNVFIPLVPLISSVLESNFLFWNTFAKTKYSWTTAIYYLHSTFELGSSWCILDILVGQCPFKEPQEMSPGLQKIPTKSWQVHGDNLCKIQWAKICVKQICLNEVKHRKLYGFGFGKINDRSYRQLYTVLKIGDVLQFWI